MYQAAALESLLGGRAGDGPGNGTRPYESRFLHWEERASVRRRPRRLFQRQDDDLYFPPNLYPVVLHPLVQQRGPLVVRTLLIQRLHDYLYFTTELESLLVIPVATKISRGRSGLLLPGQMRSDAFKIVTDEAWHAQFSDDFTQQVARATGVAPLPQDEAPAFVRRLDEIRHALPPEIRGIEMLLLAIVSETLISGILSELPRDERLPGSVRDLVRDHAEDEGRHHVFFRAVLRILWPALTPGERRAIGPHLPAIVHAFLEPDYARTATQLCAVGFTIEEAAHIISETWPAKVVSAEVNDYAGPAIRYFAQVGAMDDAATEEAFELAGLDVPPTGVTHG